MAQSVKPISSPIPVSWYPTLSVLMLDVGLFITASFFIYEATSSRKTRNMSKDLLTGCIHLFGFRIIVPITCFWSLCLWLIFSYLYRLIFEVSIPLLLPMWRKMYRKTDEFLHSESCPVSFPVPYVCGNLSTRFLSTPATFQGVLMLLYCTSYLKAQFHFDKDQFADLMIIGGVAGTVSQLVLMPILAPALGERKLLSLGLFFSFLCMMLNSVAWSSWVPYAASLTSVLSIFAKPCLRSIASKEIGPCEQGKAQGCLTGICSFANIVSPLVFSPLTALFLSERAPFHFPGFSIACAAFAGMIAFILSITLRPDLGTSSSTGKVGFGEP